MPADIEGEKLAQAREIVRQRMEKEDVLMAMSDAEIADPGVNDNLRYPTWLHETFVAINRTRKLDKLIEKLAEKIADGDQSDPDARTLLQIVETARAPAATGGSAKTTTDPAPGNGAQSSEAQPAAAPVEQIKISRYVRRTRIILLGEATALSVEELGESRKNAVSRLTEAFRTDGITVVDWGDRWGARATPELEDVNALFMRVVNDDIVAEDFEQLAALPQKLAQKLKLTGGIDAAQILIWNCEAGQKATVANAAVTPEDSGRAEVKKRFSQEKKLFFADEPVEQLVGVVRARLGLDRWPPSVGLEHPGDNVLILDKLVDIIKSSTQDKCQPAMPAVTFMEAEADLKDVVNDEAARDGIIIAIHDLNLSLTDDRNAALWAFQDRLSEYDRYLSEIIKSKNVPKTKLLKLAFIMAAANKLVKGKYPYAYLHRDWTIVGMRRDKEAAVLEESDQSLIKTKIDALLGAAS